METKVIKENQKSKREKLNNIKQMKIKKQFKRRLEKKEDTNMC